MEFIDFFADFEKAVLKEEFKRERRDELWKWLRANWGKGGRTYGPGELTKELLERKATLSNGRTGGSLSKSE